METVTANVTGPSRRAKLHGREHLVVPMSMLVPGVLHGSRGPLLYSAEEVARDPAAWNAFPIVLNHPEREGLPVSARDPDILEGVQLGQVFRARAPGKLTAEGWFDVAQTRKTAPAVLNALTAGRPLELSTGLTVDAEPAPEGAAYNGKPYTHVARRLQPDHLAVLPDQVGACSLADGCGVLVNAVELTDRDRERGADARRQAEAGHNPPSWVADEATWEKAKAAADEANCTDYWACVAAIYFKMGGTMNAAANGSPAMSVTPTLTSNCATSPVVSSEPVPVATPVPAAPAAPVLSPEQFWQAAPADFRAAIVAQVRNAVAEEQERTALIGHLTAGYTAEALPAAQAAFAALPLEALRAVAAGRTPAAPSPAANWLGAAGTAPAPPVTQEPLPQPAPNWAGWRKAG